MKENWHQLVREALSEDIGSGDITAQATIKADASVSASIFSKQNGVLSGIQVAVYAFSSLDNTLKFKQFFEDGAVISSEDEILQITGKTTSILMSERVALNFLSHLSGVATLTRSYVERIKDTSAKIIDTRKTTPLLRALEKEAVRAGGGYNHRMGLYDMILIKENHIKAAGSISKAVEQTHKFLSMVKLDARIEIETTNLDEVIEALSVRVDRIMLDNMSLKDIRKAVEIVEGRVELEASGGITLETVRAVALTGIDYISVGALTHSFNSFDFTLLFNG